MLRDIGVDVDYDVIRDVVVGRPWVAETILLAVQVGTHTRRRTHALTRARELTHSYAPVNVR